MAYENILFYKPNMAVRNSFFYLFDYSQKILTQKRADGGVSFQYPVNLPVSFTQYSVGDVICLQFDGFSFWTLQVFSDNSGVLLRRWVITNFICELVDQFPKINSTTFKYLASTFSLEYYNTALSEVFLSGSTYIVIDEYTDSRIFEGTTLGLYNERYGSKEIVTVDHVDGTFIYLTTPLYNSFYTGDLVVITPSLYLFNNYYLADNTKGSLIVIDPSNGVNLYVKQDVEYFGVTASKFCRLQNILPDYTDVHTLAYVKGTNLKMRDMSDIFRYKASLLGSDTFIGEDLDLPNPTLWSVSNGNPYIKNNSLFCSTDGNGHDSISSKYVILGDFNCQVNGHIEGYTTYTGIDIKEIHQYIKVNNATKNYTFGLYYFYMPDNLLFFEDFTTTSGTNWLDISNTASYTSGYMSHLLDGSQTMSSETITLPTDPCFISFDFKNSGKGSGNDQLHVSPLYVDDNNRLTVYMRTYNPSDQRVYLIKKISGTETTLFSSSKYNYYNEAGNWFRVNIYKYYTVIYFKIWKIGETEPVTWDWTSTWGNILTQGNFLVNTALTSLDGAGVDNITFISKTFADYNNKFVFGLFNDTTLLNYSLLGSLSELPNYVSYDLDVTKVADTLTFKYRTLVSGTVDIDWTPLPNISIDQDNLYVSLGMFSKLVTISGSYFNNFVYTSGYLSYPIVGDTYCGIMNIDNVKKNQSTIIPIYAIDIEGDNLYRLQKDATYFGIDYTWTTYNFQISPLRSFIDFITIDADSHILPATGRNTTVVRSLVFDQYGNGVVYKPVSFVEDDPVGFMTSATVYTDFFYGTGTAITGYTSGTALRVVNIVGSVTQVD